MKGMNLFTTLLYPLHRSKVYLTLFIILFSMAFNVNVISIDLLSVNVKVNRLLFCSLKYRCYSLFIHCKYSHILLNYGVLVY